MLAPRLYIFGVPDGFDMLEGTRQEISYFQRFYDGSTEDTKFTSHRDSSGNVTYTFLKYNLSSGKSRTGSFFGMSLAFSGVYCNHPLRLYELFDYVYQNHVLCNTSDASKGILKPIVNSDIKAQYFITRFEDRKEHIKFVEKVFQHNLATDDVLTTSFYPLNPGFKNENQNLVVKLPLVVEFEDEKQREIYRSHFEESLIGRFREYSYVTISPDWKPKVVDNTKEPDPDDVEIAPQKIVQWNDLIPEYQRYIIRGLGNLTNIVLDEVKRYQKQTEEILDQLKKYSYNKNIAPSIQTNYEELCNQLADLGGKTPPPPPPPPPPTHSFWDNVKKWITDNKSKAAIITGTIAALVVILVLIRPKKDGKPEQYCCVDDVTNAFNEQLKNEDFTNIKLDTISLTKAGLQFKELLQHRLDSAILCQTNRINSSVKDAIENKNWKLAFQHCDSYYDTETKNAQKSNVEKACIDYFEIEIEKLDDNNYFKKARSIKDELNMVKNQLDESEYKRLDGIVDSKKPKELTTQPKTDSYVVEFYYADNNFNPTKLYRSVTSTQSISVEQSKNYFVKIKKNDKYLENLSSAVVTISDNNTFYIRNKGIRLYWNSSKPNETITIGNITVTITKN